MNAPARHTLVLVPGLLCDARLWRPQIAALAGIADCWTADHTRAETMAGVAADLIHAAPFEKFALAGLSMGGYVALEVMRQAKDRVVRLALLDTSARADTPQQSQKRRGFISLAERGRFVGVTDALLPSFVHASHLADAKLMEIIKQMARDTGKEAFIRQERAIMSRSDSLPLLRSIGCPTLVLCGRQDTLTPLEHHQEMARAIPGAVLEVIENCGHLSTLEKPLEVSAALRRWLDA
jgi:pimeloyl-ACP methyl ester carboxylesterase